MAPDGRPESGEEWSPLGALQQARSDASTLVNDLEAELAAIAESTQASPDDEHDAEGSTVGYERARVTGLLVRARRTLADVDVALEHLRAGTYGNCVGCAGPIPAERLAALPTTARCAACAVAQPGSGRLGSGVMRAGLQPRGGSIARDTTAR